MPEMATVRQRQAGFRINDALLSNHIFFSHLTPALFFILDK